jgi:lysophospholipid acyltransferase (LPLAT)-like uncharacterized protein
MRSKIIKKISYKVLPYITIFIQKILFLTCKKVHELPNCKLPSKPVVWVGWHGQLLMLPYGYFKLKPTRKINIMVSEHIHGDMAIRIAKRFHFNFIRGSSRRGAIKALINAINALNRGEDVGITPDGPIGPLYSVSDGVVTLSQKYNIDVIALGWSASSYWQLGSWDKAKIPKPFSTIIFRSSEPFNLEGLSKEEAKQKIKNALMNCINK